MRWARVNDVAVIVALSSTALLAPACPSLSQQGPDKTDAEKAEFHYQLANNSFYAKEITVAISDLYKALELDPNHAKAHHLLGFIYFGRKQFSDAAEHFRKALAIDPRYFEARANLGALYLSMERWQDAIDILTPLAEERLYPTPYLVHNNLGFAYFNLGDMDNALQRLRMAVFLKPEMCLAHNNLGRVYMALGQMDLAVRAFDRASRKCTDYVEPLYWLGEVYRSTGQGELARQSFEKCYELGPETPIGMKCGELR